LASEPPIVPRFRTCWSEQGAAGCGGECRHQRRGEQRRGRAAQVAAHVAQHEDEAGVGEGRQHAEQCAALGVGAEGVRADRAGDQHRAGEDERDGDRDPPRWALPEQQPGGDRDEHDLQVGEHRREARADVDDRVVPQD